MEVEEIELLADKGYYNAIEIKECVDNGITPYIAEPEARDSRDAVIYHGEDFSYNTNKDVYICPNGSELTFRGKAPHHGRVNKLYKSEDYKICRTKTECTKSKHGRVIYR